MSQISDLFKRIKELEEQLQEVTRQQDVDYQNALDKMNNVKATCDSFKVHLVHISNKIEAINKKIVRIEKELGIKDRKYTAPRILRNQGSFDF